MDDRVVEAVAGDPVDLVDDAVADRVRGDVVEHVLQGAPPGGLGGFAGFDEFSDDDRAELFGLALRGLPLSGDGQAFFLPVAAGLVFRRDPQVGDRRYQSLSGTGLGGLLRLVGRACGEGSEGCEVEPCREIEERHGVTAFPKPSPTGLGGWGAEWRSRQNAERTPLR
ncbi:MAG TPA: hypothetical protein VK046_06580 [Actinomycetaceae bacterium]|nr:hypothetical protein [Actinomycetaceae bacterium]